MNKLANYPKDNYIKLKGRVKIELFDAESGDLVNKFEDNNVVLQYPHDIFFKEAQRGVILANGQQSYDNNINFYNLIVNTFANFSPNSIPQFNYLSLTDSTNPTSSPETEYTWPGKLLGYCDLGINADTGIFRGSISPTESYFDEKGFHFVFNFGTLKCNGTIGSVCWSYFQPTSTYKYTTTHPLQRKLYDVVRDVNIGKSTINESNLEPLKYFGGTPGGSDGYFYGRRTEATINKIYKFRLDTNLAQTYDIGLPNSVVGDFVIIGEYTVWCHGTAGTGLIYIKNGNGTGDTTTLDLNSFGTFNVIPGALATDGTNLFICQYLTSYTTSTKVLVCNIATDVTFTWGGTSVFSSTPDVHTIVPSTDDATSFSHFYMQYPQIVCKTNSGIWDGYLYLTAQVKNAIALAESGYSGPGDCSNVRTVRINMATDIAEDLRKSWKTNSSDETIFLGPEEKIYISKLAKNPGAGGYMRTNIYRINIDTFNPNLLARRVLSPTIEKTSSNTMRITYDVTFEDTQSTVGWG
jgi:hypothetical protein